MSADKCKCGGLFYKVNNSIQSSMFLELQTASKMQLIRAWCFFFLNSFLMCMETIAYVLKQNREIFHLASLPEKDLFRLKQSIKPKGNLCLLIFKYLGIRRKLNLRIPPLILPVYSLMGD